MFTVTPVVAPCLAVMLKIPCASIPVIFCPWKRETLICSCAKASTIERQRTKMTNDIFFVMICFMMGRLKVTKSYRYSCFLLKKRDMGLLFFIWFIKRIGDTGYIPRELLFPNEERLERLSIFGWNFLERADLPFVWPDQTVRRLKHLCKVEFGKVVWN